MGPALKCFRGSQAASLWLFMASNVSPFIAYFRGNKGEMKGPLKGNALPWHSSALWDVSRMAPRWMLPVPCYLPYDAPSLGLASHPLSCCAMCGLDLGAKNRDAGTCGRCSQSPATSLSASVSLLSQAGRSQPLLKSLARCYSFLSFPCCC